jgi:hypothetical protein
VKVSVVRGGGLAGITTRTELARSSLPADEAETLDGLVEEAGVRHPAPAPSGRHPDQMLYEVAVSDDDGDVRARFTDEDLPEGARRLIEWIDSRPERTHRIAT